MFENIDKIKKIRDACLANAESCLSVAERELDTGVDHICFHLALIALEEIGKAMLVTIGHTVTIAGRDNEGLRISVDDHIKKLFWALWSGLLIRKQFSKEQIEQNKNLATTLHEKRLFYLYTDPSNPLSSSDKINEGEAETLVKLVRARLEIEKASNLTDKFEIEDVENLKWFFKATEDVDKRKFIFSSVSLNKLDEFKNGKDWIKWIREIYHKNEEEMRKLAEQEITRQKPSSDEASKPKFKMRIRIQSQSHSIRNNAFSKWNQSIRDIRVYKSDKKDMAKFAKSELLVDFTFPKAVPIHVLWDHGFFMAKTFVVALNIATRGLFWWNVAKDIETYFEEITDLEADKNEKVKIGMALGKRLSLNWEEAKLTLDQEEMGKVNMIYAFLLKEHKKLKKVLQTYAFGLVIFSKIDIHLRLEANAFEEFFKALKHALILFEDWDGKDNLKEALKKQFNKLPNLQELDATIQLGIDLDLQHDKAPNITLTEIASMKLYCDYYLQMKASEYFKKLRKVDPALMHC